jgi:PleD family two-component response regulator
MHANGNGNEKHELEDQRVMVVDDEEMIHNLSRHYLSRHNIEVVSVRTNEEALVEFETYDGKFDAIGFDGHVSGSNLDTLELVKRISSRFSGPMVAFSSNPAYQGLMIDSGCNYQCRKENFPKKVLELLGIRT